MKGLLRKLGDMAAEAVFPSNIYCICCGSLIDGTRLYALCDKCMKKMHWITGQTCGKCGKALPDTFRGKWCYDCMRQQHAFTRGFSCLTYGLHEREILMDLKYNGKGYLARKLGDVLYDRIVCEDITPDLIVPVPVGRQREKTRGYNQSALMAKRLSQRWGVPWDAGLLIRRKETAPLRSLNPAERELALEGVFGVRGAARLKSADQSRSADGVVRTDHCAARGKTILLVDDIYTTGATADACSRALLHAGAKEVYLLTLASGGNRKPDREK